MTVSGLLLRVKRAWYFLRHGKHLVLIYTMGKVGSAGIKAGLKKEYPFIPAFHIHFLSDNWLKKILPSMHAFFHANIRDANVVLNYLQRHPGQRLKIITIVRDPIERDISDIFQNWKGRLGERTINDLTFTELTESFNKDDHSYTLNWFDTELKEYLGFDMYSQPFDYNRGYSIYQSKNADILCIQLEQMNARLTEATEKLLGYGITPEEGVNLSADKEGKELYKEMIRQYKAPEQKLATVYGHRFMQHFYSPEQIAKMKQRWSA